MSDVTLNDLPPSTATGIEQYVEDHRPVGDFLRSVLSNDLRNALMLADEHNRAAIHDTVMYLLNNVPAVCWGSREAYNDWINHSGG